MRRMLVVIDMQNDFVDGALGTAEAQSIVPAVVEKILSYPPDCVWATRDTHHEDYLLTQEGRNLPVVHCVEGSDGWQLCPQVSEALSEGTRIFDKPCFGSVELVSELAELAESEPIEVEFVGLCTDICVVAGALLAKVVMPEVPITVDSACCAGVTPEGHEAALETMRSCQVKVL